MPGRFFFQSAGRNAVASNSGLADASEGLDRQVRYIYIIFGCKMCEKDKQEKTEIMKIVAKRFLQNAI